jgi:hypothetical protein
MTLVPDRHSVTVPEDGTSGFGVKLSNAPPEGTSILMYAAHSGGDADISVVTEGPLVFDDSNWDVFHEVLLAAAEDDDMLAGRASIRLWANIELDGQQLNTIEDGITAVELDNDELHFIVSTNTVTLAEGENATVAIKLNNEPATPVVASVARTGDEDISLTSPSTLVFDRSNWFLDQTLTFYAAPDADEENGTARFTVSADAPDVGGAIITAVELETTEALLYMRISTWRYFGTGDFITESQEGVIPITLDPTNFSTPLGYGYLQYDYVSSWLGEVHEQVPRTVTNYEDDVICPCTGASPCVQKGGPQDIRLEIGQSPAPGVPIPLGQDGLYEETCQYESDYGGYIRVELMEPGQL